MEQLTHTVRRSNWINIIQQCQARSAGTTAKQWLAENGISEKSYYYWLRKVRWEICEQGCLPVRRHFNSTYGGAVAAN